MGNLGTRRESHLATEYEQSYFQIREAGIVETPKSPVVGHRQRKGRPGGCGLCLLKTENLRVSHKHWREDARPALAVKSQVLDAAERSDKWAFRGCLMCLTWELWLHKINARTRLGELLYIVIRTLAQGEDSLDSTAISVTYLLSYLLTTQCLSFPISKGG